MPLDAERLALNIKTRWLAKPGAGITVENEMGANAVDALCASIAEALVEEFTGNAEVSGSCAGIAGGDPIVGGTITGVVS